MTSSKLYSCIAYNFGDVLLMRGQITMPPIGNRNTIQQNVCSVTMGPCVLCGYQVLLWLRNWTFYFLKLHINWLKSIKYRNKVFYFVKGRKALFTLTVIFFPFSFLFGCHETTVPLCNPDWFGTHNPPASASKCWDYRCKPTNQARILLQSSSLWHGQGSLSITQQESKH